MQGAEAKKCAPGHYANLGEVIKSSCVPKVVDFLDSAVRNLTGHQPWTLPTMPPSPLPQPKSRQRQPFPVHKWAAVELRAMDMAGNY